MTDGDVWDEETEVISVVIYGKVLEKCIGTIGGD